MHLLESMIYGFISGLAEIFPVSSQANQMVMRQLFGISQKEPIRDLLIHIAILAAVFVSCHGLFARIRRERVLAHRMRRNPSQIRALKGIYDMRLVRSAVPIMVIGLFANLFFGKFYQNRPLFSLVLLINGAITLVPTYLHLGNKDARSMSGFDGFLIGLAAAFSAIPGVSRNSAIMSVTLIRGAEKENGVTWSMLLCVPAMVVMALIDLISIFTVGVGNVTLAIFGGYIISALMAFAGAYIAVSVVSRLIHYGDYSGFAFYDFGLALLSFVLYLIV